MRRYLSLILVLSLLLPCLVVPASATTAGVIDAIEDLAEGLGTSQGDIVELLTSIDEWIYECYSSLTEISNSVWLILEEYCTPMYDYFFTPNQTATQYMIVKAASGYALISATVTTTGFQCDLVYSVTNGLTKIEYYIRQFFTGDTTVSDEVEDQVNQDSTEASEYLDIMDDVTKPDEGELDDISDVSDYIDSGDVGVLADAYAPIFQNATFLAMTMLSLTFALIAFTLYGKR